MEPFEDPDNGFGYDLNIDGEEELILQRLAQTEDHFTFFDVGANRGDWTGFILDHIQTPYTGHLFEISQVMQRRLYARHSHHPGLVFNNFGLSDTEEEVEFRRYVGAEGVNTILTEGGYWENKLESVLDKALVMTGDKYCGMAGIERIDLLKIDTEGWEMNVLRGFDRMFTEQRIAVAQFEYGYMNGENHTVARDFWRYLEPKGYHLGRLHKTGIDWGPFRFVYNNFTSGPNFVAASPDAMKDAS